MSARSGSRGSGTRTTDPRAGSSRPWTPGLGVRSRSVGRRGGPVLLAVLCALVVGCGSEHEPTGTAGTGPPPLASARPPDGAAAQDPPQHGTQDPPPAAPTAPPTPVAAPVTSDPQSAPPVLQGVTVVLDAGHNGRNAADPARLASPVPAGGFTKACNTVGASTDSGYAEHAFTIDVVLRAAALLRARGATVVLTRDDDEGFGPCVDARAAIGNRAEADAVVSVHADGGPARGRGFHVIAPALAPDGGNADVLEPSYRLAVTLRDAFRSGTGMPVATYTATDGLVRRDDLAGLNLARVPVVLLESGNMRNAADAEALRSPAWRARAAAAVATAVQTFVTAG